MKKLLLLKNNSFDTIIAPTLEELNHEKNKLELKNNELFDVCCFGNDDTPIPTTYFKIAPKTIRVFKTKTIKIRNDFEQWCDVQGVEQTGGSDNESSTIVSHYKIMTLSRIILILFH